MLKISFEIFRALSVLFILSYLLWVGKKERINRQKGWWVIITGTSVVLLGAVFDVIHSLRVLFGKTIYITFLIDYVSYFNGYLFLFVILLGWLPLVGALKKAEQDLKKDNERLEVLVNERTARLTEMNTQLKAEVEEHRQTTKRLNDTMTKLFNETERFHTLIAQAPFGMAMIAEDGKFLYVNPGFQELFGYGLEDVPDGKTWFRRAFPDDGYRHNVISTWVNDLKISKVGMRRERVFTVLCKDGAKKIINFIPVLLNSRENLVACEDITERVYAVQALKESEERYRTLVESQGEGVVVLNEDDQFAFANPAAELILGVPKGTLLGMDLKSFLEPEQLAIAVEQKKSFHNRDKNSYELEVKRPDGKKRILLITATEQFDRDGKFIGMFEVFRDITERKIAEDERKEAYEKLQTILERTVGALARTAEMRDPYTAGHQKRVTELALAIGHEMNLPPDSLETIRIAGILHDLGKISVPVEILSKPGRISTHEFYIIKEHPQVGYEILKRIEFQYPVAPIVLQHHEKLNGSGYPSNLSGEEILLEAKILAVADIVEAISSHRPYRPSLGVKKALEEIIKNKGILYDTEVVDTCVKLFKEKGFQFEWRPESNDEESQTSSDS